MLYLATSMFFCIACLQMRPTKKYLFSLLPRHSVTAGKEQDCIPQASCVTDLKKNIRLGRPSFSPPPPHRSCPPHPAPLGWYQQVHTLHPHSCSDRGPSTSNAQQLIQNQVKLSGSEGKQKRQILDRWFHW